MRHHSGIFLPFLSHNSAAILLKKRQKPAQKHVSNILRKNFKQLLKSNIKRVHSIQTDTKITNKFAPLTASAYLCITMKEVLVISSSLRQRSAPDAFAEAFARGAAEAGNAALEEACELGKKII